MSPSRSSSWAGRCRSACLACSPTPSSWPSRFTCVSCSARSRGWRAHTAPNGRNTHVAFPGGSFEHLEQLCHMRRDVLHLFSPTAIVHTEGFGPTGRRDLVEPGFGED